MIRVGVLRFLLLFLLVRVYRIPLASYAALARDLAITSAVSLGRYLYAGHHSFIDIKKAVCALHRSMTSSEISSRTDRPVAAFDNRGGRA
jgi:hypothetical protein